MRAVWAAAGRLLLKGSLIAGSLSTPGRRVGVRGLAGRAWQGRQGLAAMRVRERGRLCLAAGAGYWMLGSGELEKSRAWGSPPPWRRGTRSLRRVIVRPFLPSPRTA